MVLFLMAEGDLQLIETYRSTFVLHGDALIFAKDGFEAIKKLERTSFDLVIAESSLPRMSGWEFAEYLNLIRYPAPLLFITTEQELEEELPLYNVTPTTILVKPIQTEDLLSAIERILKQTLPSPTNETAPFPILTNQERKLFELLSSENRVFSKEELLLSINEEGRESTIHTVEVHINNLRNKLKESCYFIVTKRGKGYRLQKT